MLKTPEHFIAERISRRQALLRAGSIALLPDTAFAQGEDVLQTVLATEERLRSAQLLISLQKKGFTESITSLPLAPVPSYRSLANAPDLQRAIYPKMGVNFNLITPRLKIDSTYARIFGFRYVNGPKSGLVMTAYGESLMRPITESIDTMVAQIRKGEDISIMPRSTWTEKSLKLDPIQVSQSSVDRLHGTYARLTIPAAEPNTEYGTDEFFDDAQLIQMPGFMLALSNMPNIKKGLEELVTRESEVMHELGKDWVKGSMLWIPAPVPSYQESQNPLPGLDRYMLAEKGKIEIGAQDKHYIAGAHIYGKSNELVAMVSKCIFVPLKNPKTSQVVEWPMFLVVPAPTIRKALQEFDKS